MSTLNFATLGAITLHYQREGVATGIPLVFINSLGSDLRIWDEVCERLAARHPLLRYDKRGHGLSDCPPGPYTLDDHAADLAGLLDHLQIEQAILVGISVGGMIALAFSLAHPERVDRLVICDSGAKIGTTELWNSRIETVRQQGLSSMVDAVLARWLTPSFAQAQPAAYRGYANMLARTPAEGYAATCAALRDADLTVAVGAIQTPTLVLCGAEDVATPPALGQALANALPNASFELIEDAAHLPCIEQPGATAAAIGRFLQADGPFTANRLAQGMQIRRSVLGNAHVDRAEANKTDFDADFQRMITEFAWGTVWAGTEIDRPTRHMITIAILAALGKEHELTLHLRATQNTGVTSQQIKAALHQVAVYAGIPAANTAFAIAKRVLADREVEKVNR